MNWTVFRGQFLHRAVRPDRPGSGTVPLFAAATSGASPPARRLMSVYIALFSFVFLTFFLSDRRRLLKFFGISMPAFRIAGGVLLFLMGLDMARGDMAEVFVEANEEVEKLSTRAYARKRFEGLIVPFGNAAADRPRRHLHRRDLRRRGQGHGLAGWLVGTGVIAPSRLSILASFWMTGLINRLLGKIGMIIVVRVLGLILCAMAVQFHLAGLADSTIGFVRRGVATPYQ